MGAQESVVLVGATLIDGTGGPPLPRARVLIAEGRIACVSGPDGCVVDGQVSPIDLSGAWLTPGLIDTHVHTAVERYPDLVRRQQALRFALGITAVRVAGDLQIEALLLEREHSEVSTTPLPRIVVAERPASPYDERFGVPLGRPLVEHLVGIGVEAVKLKDHTNDDSLYFEEIEAGNRLGVTVYGHVWRSLPFESLLERAVDAGLDGISHIDAFALAAQPDSISLPDLSPDDDPAQWASIKSMWLTADDARLRAVARHAIDAGVWLEPTLGIEYYWERGLWPPRHLAFLRERPVSVRDMLAGRDPLDEEVPPTFPEAYARMAAFIGTFHDMGGVVITGTDGLRPGLGLHEEIALLRHAGLDPIESIHAATGAAAWALGREDIGTVEVGKLADLAVHGVDPLGPPRSTLHVVRVIKGGVMYDSDALLEPFRQDYEAMEAALWRDRALRAARLAALAMVVMALLVGARALTKARST